MRFILAAALSIGVSATAQAQTPLTGTTGPQTSTPPVTAAPARPARHTLEQRFDAANTTHDGHLTSAQAQAGMPAVARNFSAIDKDNKGYVTIDDVRGYNRARRAARAKSQ